MRAVPNAHRMVVYARRARAPSSPAPPPPPRLKGEENRRHTKCASLRVERVLISRVAQRDPVRAGILDPDHEC